MCFFADVFIPSKSKETVILPDTPDGVKYRIDEFIHDTLSRVVQGKPGVSLRFDNGHCLCQYNDWKVLFEYVDVVRFQNNLEEVRFLLYWSDRHYPDVKEVEFDLEIQEVESRPQEGVVYTIGPAIKTRLELWKGRPVDITFKSRKRKFGTVVSFSPNDGNGMLTVENTGESIYFNDREIRLVELIK